MWLCYMPKVTVHGFMLDIRVSRLRASAGIPEADDLHIGGYIVIWTADHVWQPGWLPSQQDLVAEDWVLLAK